MPATRSTTARGYGSRHQRERAKYRPLVESGNAYCTEPLCLMPTRWIDPAFGWDLAHGPTRDTYRGPAHVKCNRTEGAKRRGKTRQARRRWRL